MENILIILGLTIIVLGLLYINKNNHINKLNKTIKDRNKTINDIEKLLQFEIESKSKIIEANNKDKLEFDNKIAEILEDSIEGDKIKLKELERLKKDKKEFAKDVLELLELTKSIILKKHLKRYEKSLVKFKSTL